MDEIRQDNQCIEWETDFGPSYFFSVFEYEDGHRWAQRLSNPRARAFHDVSWAEERRGRRNSRLSGRGRDRGQFRICNWDVFDAQMRELLGLTGFAVTGHDLLFHGICATCAEDQRRAGLKE